MWWWVHQLPQLSFPFCIPTPRNSYSFVIFLLLSISTNFVKKDDFSTIGPGLGLCVGAAWPAWGRGIFIPKTIGNRKRDCARGCAWGINTT